MVEYTFDTNGIFEALADGIRRDILLRVYGQEMNISQIAIEYDISMAAVSRHVLILESAGLVCKMRSGKERIVRFVPESFDELIKFVDYFRQQDS